MKQIKSLVMLAFMLMLITTGLVAQAPAGSGTKADPYRITTVDELRFAAVSLDGRDAHYILMNDLDLAELANWTPIGTEGIPFTGSFDGRGHVIRNLTLTTASGASGNFAGLFGWFAPAIPGDYIKNLGLVNADITSTNQQVTGSLIGNMEGGLVFNCFADSSIVRGTTGTGGLIGRMRSGAVVSRSWVNMDTIRAGASSGVLVGMLGANSATASLGNNLVENCFATGLIISTGSAGGLVGQVAAGNTVRNNLSTATIVAGTAAGGITGNYSSNAEFSSLVSNNVVLNPSITVTGTATGTNAVRVVHVGTAANPQLRSNLALETMELFRRAHVDSVPILLHDSIMLGADTLNGRHGLSITEAAAKLQATYTTAPFNWNFTNIWKMSEDGYPELIPAHVFTEGRGTKEIPYVIRTAEDLRGIHDYLHAHFIVAEDIDLTGIDWIPIGTQTMPFTGSFDGAGHVIRNLKIDVATTDVGLFGWFEPAIVGDYIKNIGLVDADVKTSHAANVSAVGALVGTVNNGLIFNCYADDSKVEGGGQIGGLVGRLQSARLIQSWANCEVTATASAGSAGALVANVTHLNATAPRSLVDNCFALGSVNAGNFASGLVGMASQASTVRNSYTAATVVARGATAAGIVGSLSGNSVVSNNVSLAPSIKSTTNVFRIANAATILRNNYALETIALEINSGPVTSLTADSLNGTHGQSITAAQVSLAATYTTAPFDWNFTNVWQIDGVTNRPILRNVPAVESITFSKESDEVVERSTLQLEWTILPAGADPSVLFVSLDESIATVNGFGIVSAVDLGTTRVVGLAADGKTDTITIDVIRVPVESVEFAKRRLEIELGRGIAATAAERRPYRDTLEWTVLPAGSNQNVTFRSLDTAVLLVIDSTAGIIEGIKLGEAKVVVYTEDPAITDTLEVEVIKVSLDSIQFALDTIEMVFGHPRTLRWTIFPVQADSAVTFESLDPTILTVNEKGIVTALVIDTAKIAIHASTPERGDDVSDTIVVVVQAPLFVAGSGTKSDPYVITTPQQLNQMRNAPNCHYLLGNDLDMSVYDTIFQPIGTQEDPFSGSFNGGGHTISNLHIRGAARVALFGRFEPETRHDAIENIVMENSTIRGTGLNVASIVGHVVGGVVQDITSTARIFAGSTGSGIVGEMSGGSIVRRCFFGDTITGSGTAMIGGVVRQVLDSSLVTDCYSTGHLENSPGASGVTGGVVAQLSTRAIVQNSYSSATIIGAGRTGGIVGTVSSSALTEAQLRENPNRLPNLPIVRNCVAINPIIRGGRGTTTYAAGFGTQVHRIAANIGGEGDTASRIIANNFALLTTEVYRNDTLIPIGRLADSLNGQDGESVPMAELQTQGPYNFLGWDFTNIWMMNPEGDRLPIFGVSDGTSIQDLIVESFVHEAKVKVYPNPTSGPVTVEVEGETAIRQILIYSTNGQLAFTTTKPEFSIEHLRNGMYVAIIITDKGNFVSRIIKW